MIKLQDMPRQQRIVVTLVFLAIVAFSVVSFVAPRGSFVAWKTQQFMMFSPSLLLGYVLGVWVGSTPKNKK